MKIAVEKARTGLMFDQSRSFYPSRMFGYDGSSQAREVFKDHSSYFFGFVSSGEIEVQVDQLKKSVPLQTGMYFGLSGEFSITGTGTAAIIERVGFRGLLTFGGPVEEHGRLLYIDHCRSSLLISPQRMGEPCLNLLTFPPNIHQTMHVHPTVRFGIVYSGNGKSVTPTESLELKPGSFFHIPEGAPHCFVTEAGPMSIIAYHPDTDWGPTDEAHPMLNRTFRKI